MANDAKIILSAEDRTRAAFQSAIGNFDKLGIAGDKLSSSLLTIFGGVTIGGIVAMGVQIAKDVDAFNDLKDTTGASIENISALDRIARETGGTFEGVSSSLVKFNKVLQEVKLGSDEDSVFKKLGLDVAELRTLDPAEALLKTAQAFQKFGIDGDYARSIQILFGKSVREVAPLLKDLAEKGELVATTSTQMAEEMEALNKEFYKLSANSTDVKRAFMGDLAIGLNAAFKAFKEAREESNLLVASMKALQAIFQGSEKNQTDKRLVDLTDKLLVAQNMLDASRSAGDNARRIKAREEEVNRLKEEIRLTQSYRTVLDGVNEAKAPDKPAMGRVGGGSAKEAKGPRLDMSNKEMASYLESLQKTYDKTQDLTTVEAALLELRRKGAGVSLADAGRIINLAQQIDKEKELAEAIKMRRDEVIAAGDAVNKENEAYQKRLKSLLDATPAAEFAKRQSDIELLQTELEAGRISAEQYAEAIAARFNIAGEEIKKTKSLTEELGLSFKSAFEDAVLEGKKFGDVLKGLANDIGRIILRKSVTEPLGNWVSSNIGNLFGGFRAEGGSVFGNTPYIVGERGPELFVPGSSGNVIPNNKLSGGMTFAPVTNISVAGGMNQGEVISTVSRALAENNRNWSAQLQRAGVLA